MHTRIHVSTAICTLCVPITDEDEWICSAFGAIGMLLLALRLGFGAYWAFLCIGSPLAQTDLLQPGSYFCVSAAKAT
jgi:hypothetical protein